MATSPYVYVGNVKRFDGTVSFRFRSSEDDQVYTVLRGQVVNLNTADLAKLDDRFILVPEGEAPEPDPLIRSLEFIDEASIPIGEVLTRTSRGYEFEPAGISGSWKQPVADAASLPTEGNSEGDVRLALDDFAMYYWHAAAWHPIVGGSPPPPDEDFINVAASLVGLDDGEILIWDTADSRFEPGAL